jgi:hypothetical protein
MATRFHLELAERRRKMRRWVVGLGLAAYLVVVWLRL